MRVSVTTLESFRYVLTHEWALESELAASIRGERVETWQMSVGTAFHAVLGRRLTIPKPYEGHGAYSFPIEDVREAKSHVGDGGVYEVKATKVFHVLGHLVSVVAQADRLRGLCIDEFKCKFSTPDPKDYDQSLQWRFYLAIHGAACVRYSLFHLGEPDSSGVVQLKGIGSFRFWPYQGLEQDCIDALAAFVGWASDRRLLGYLQRESSTPEAA